MGPAGGTCVGAASACPGAAQPVLCRQLLVSSYASACVCTASALAVAEPSHPPHPAGQPSTAPPLQMFNSKGDMRLALEACSLAAEIAAKAAATAAAKAVAGGQGSKDGSGDDSPSSAPPKPASKLVSMPQMAEALNAVCGALRCAYCAVLCCAVLGCGWQWCAC